MNAIDIINNIVNNSNLREYPFKYCLVDNNKVPYTYKDKLCHPNNINEFCSLLELLDNLNLMDYKGVGVSIQGSNICAIDIDHCFEIPFDFDTLSPQIKPIINFFKEETYIEFSFSGTGLRIFFLVNNMIENYSDIYYIKNSKAGIEFYTPYFSYRYVTITGRYIFNNPVKILDLNKIYVFLNNYMKRPKTSKISKISHNIEDINECMVKVKKLYFKNYDFQNLWFSRAPGSGHNESELDYKLICYLYENITSNIELVKEIFMMSPYYKSKDYKHVSKFTKNNYNYFYYVIGKVR